MRKPGKRKRPVKFMVMLSKEEKEMWERAAIKLKSKSLSEFVRLCCNVKSCQILVEAVK